MLQKKAHVKSTSDRPTEYLDDELLDCPEVILKTLKFSKDCFIPTT